MTTRNTEGHRPNGDGLHMLQAELAAFSQARDWGQFHAPKNLAMALAGEVGELLSLLQWKTDEQSDQLERDERQRLTDELADVTTYLLLLADRVGVDLDTAVRDKLARNDARYPVEKSRGSSLKYDTL